MLACLLGCRYRTAFGPAGLAGHLLPTRLLGGSLPIAGTMSVPDPHRVLATPVLHVRLCDEGTSVQVQANVQHHLSFRNEAYILTLHADAAGMPNHAQRDTIAHHSLECPDSLGLIFCKLGQHGFCFFFFFFMLSTFWMLCL